MSKVKLLIAKSTASDEIANFIFYEFENLVQNL